jgi:hypothetical protein
MRIVPQSRLKLADVPFRFWRDQAIRFSPSFSSMHDVFQRLIRSYGCIMLSSSYISFNSIDHELCTLQVVSTSLSRLAWIRYNRISWRLTLDFDLFHTLSSAVHGSYASVTSPIWPQRTFMIEPLAREGVFTRLAKADS